MEYTNIITYLGLICILIAKSFEFRCERTPENVSKPRNRNDIGRYVIEISGNPDSYVPLEVYTISLRLNPTAAIKRTFREFTLSLEYAPAETGEDDIQSMVGSLHIGEDTMAKFSDTCPNTVIQVSTLPKTEIQVIWRAPPSKSGCVVFKGTVVESKDNWFSEDGPLTKKLCEEETLNIDTPPVVLKHCCACGEAKYELTFEGTWSRNTHPKDFPLDVFSTRFSDVIGASHTHGHSFWNYNGLASDGLKSLAEDGNTRMLEEELIEMGDDVRTIIKACGLSYPNIKGRTYSLFKVTNNSHLVSLVSKITPSPDWVVGIANLEMCTRECSWVESRILNIYPWDVGTDDGITYTSKKEPSRFHQPIRRIKSNSPNDESSPFYDPEGEDIKPMAKLYITRQRIYETPCEAYEPPPEGEEEDEEDGEEKCALDDWSDWSPCSSKCGEGFMYRSRKFKDPKDELECSDQVVQKRTCFGHSPNCGEENNGEDEEELSEDDPKCELSDFGEWSTCSAQCGLGTKTRDRKYKNPDFAFECKESSPVELQENEECEGEGDDCEDYEYPETQECPGTIWDEWTECNVTCGQGYKERYRIPEAENEDEDPLADCENVKTKEVVECTEICEDEESGNVFGFLDSGSHVLSNHVISEGPQGPVIDCEVTKWSVWSSCTLPPNQECGKGYKVKNRRIKMHAMNGGTPCPRKLRKLKSCIIPCEEDAGSAEIPNGEVSLDLEGGSKEEVPVDCEMGDWSAWSPCSAICGRTAVQQRTRPIKVKPKGRGAPCPSRLEVKMCPLPVACTEDGIPTL